MLKEQFYDIFTELIYISENYIYKFSHFERWNLRTSAAKHRRSCSNFGTKQFVFFVKTM